MLFLNNLLLHITMRLKFELLPSIYIAKCLAVSSRVHGTCLRQMILHFWAFGLFISVCGKGLGEALTMLTVSVPPPFASQNLVHFCKFSLQ